MHACLAKTQKLGWPAPAMVVVTSQPPNGSSSSPQHRRFFLLFVLVAVVDIIRSQAPLLQRPQLREPDVIVGLRCAFTRLNKAASSSLSFSALRSPSQPTSWFRLGLWDSLDMPVVASAGPRRASTRFSARCRSLHRADHPWQRLVWPAFGPSSAASRPVCDPFSLQFGPGARSHAY